MTSMTRTWNICVALLLAVALLGGCRATVGDDGRAAGEAFDSIELTDTSIALTVDATLEDLTRHALFKNPAVRKAYREWESKIRRISQAGTLPDPMFTFGYFIDEVETRVGAQRSKFGLSQTFPWFGTLDLKEDIAAADAMAAGEAFFVVRNRIRMDVRHAYADWVYLEKNRVIVKKNVSLIKDLKELVITRYGAAKGGFHESLRLDIELEKQKERLASLTDYAKPVAERLINLIGAPKDFSLNPPTTFPDAAPFEGTDLMAVALKNNPGLKLIDSLVEKTEVRKRLAQKQGKPTFTLGLDYIYTDKADMSGVSDSGKDPILAVIKLNLPIWRDKYDEAVKEAEAMRQAMVLNREVRERALTVELAHSQFEISKQVRRMKLYKETVIPKTQELLELLKSAYTGGKVGYVELIDVQRNLLQAELVREEAELKRFKAIATLDFLIGK